MGGAKPRYANELQQHPASHFLGFYSHNTHFLPRFSTTDTTFSSRLSIVGDTSRTEPTSLSGWSVSQIAVLGSLPYSRPTENYSVRGHKSVYREQSANPEALLPVFP